MEDNGASLRDRAVVNGAGQAVSALRASVPSAGDVAAELVMLGGRSTARALCDRLVAAGFSRRNASLGIQRATDVPGATIIIGGDFTLSVRTGRGE